MSEAVHSRWTWVAIGVAVAIVLLTFPSPLRFPVSVSAGLSGCSSLVGPDGKPIASQNCGPLIAGSSVQVSSGSNILYNSTTGRESIWVHDAYLNVAPPSLPGVSSTRTQSSSTIACNGQTMASSTQTRYYSGLSNPNGVVNQVQVGGKALASMSSGSCSASDKVTVSYMVGNVAIGKPTTYTLKVPQGISFTVNTVTVGGGTNSTSSTTSSTSTTSTSTTGSSSTTSTSSSSASSQSTFSTTSSLVSTACPTCSTTPPAASVTLTPNQPIPLPSVDYNSAVQSFFNSVGSNFLPCYVNGQSAGFMVCYSNGTPFQTGLGLRYSVVAGSGFSLGFSGLYPISTSEPSPSGSASFAVTGNGNQLTFTAPDGTLNVTYPSGVSNTGAGFNWGGSSTLTVYAQLISPQCDPTDGRCPNASTTYQVMAEQAVATESLYLPKPILTLSNCHTVCSISYTLSGVGVNANANFLLLPSGSQVCGTFGCGSGFGPAVVTNGVGSYDIGNSSGELIAYVGAVANGGEPLSGNTILSNTVSVP